MKVEEGKEVKKFSAKTLFKGVTCGDLFYLFSDRLPWSFTSSEQRRKVEKKAKNLEAWKIRI